MLIGNSFGYLNLRHVTGMKVIAASGIAGQILLNAVVEPGCWRTPPPGSHRAASARPSTAPLAPARVAAIKVKAGAQTRPERTH
jgi:hypothetical protein